MIQYPRIKIEHVFRNLSQRLISSNVAIIGSYHGGNVGDMILGNTLKKPLNSIGISSDLQTLHNLERWPKRQFAIIGGGAVGYNSALEKVFDIYCDCLENVLIIGVDFNEKKLSEKSKLFLESVRFISCRSIDQQIKLLNQLNRKDIFVQPDVAFAYPITKSLDKVNTPTLLINAIPLYGYFSHGKLNPEKQFQSERPEIFDNFETIHKNYNAFLTSVINKYKILGFHIATLPFSTEDEIYCRKYLNHLDIKLNSYSSHPETAINLIRNADTILSTRYHSSIFAMRLNKKIIPIAYAKKNEELFKSVDLKNFITIPNLLNDAILDNNEILYSKSKISLMETSAKKTIEDNIAFLRNAAFKL